MLFDYIVEISTDHSYLDVWLHDPDVLNSNKKDYAYFPPRVGKDKTVRLYAGNSYIIDRMNHKYVNQETNEVIWNPKSNPYGI